MEGVRIVASLLGSVPAAVRFTIETSLLGSAVGALRFTIATSLLGCLQLNRASWASWAQLFPRHGSPLNRASWAQFLPQCGLQLNRASWAQLLVRYGLQLNRASWAVYNCIEPLGLSVCRCLFALPVAV